MRRTTPTDGMLTQTAPLPYPLVDLLRGVQYRPDWTFAYFPNYDRGQGSVGDTLIIRVTTEDSNHPENKITVNHVFIVPAAAYDTRAWQRWLFEQILLVEKHEAMEWFKVDGGKPYAPNHGPGRDPYVIHEVGSVRDVRTSFRGEVNDH